MSVSALLNGASITWLGHGTFLISTPEGKKILIDPFLQNNPKCPEAFHEVATDAILITHGHGDHIADVFTAHERCGGPIVGMFDLTTWLGTKGVPGEKLVGMNKGGRVALEGLDVSVVMTDARHSSSFQDGDQIVYLGEPAGYLIELSNGLKIYAAGDTSVFGDMALIRRLYAPDLAILPIGDWFTMDPKAAAVACELLGVSHVIGGHWGTFPILSGTPDALEAEIQALGLETQVIKAEVGVTLG